MLDISVATISRALNGDPKVSKKTQKKVVDLAKELGYRHNSFASNLRKQKTNTIGVMVPKLSSNFITSVLAGIEKAASQEGYDLLIANSSEDSHKEIANAENLFHKRVDGLLVSLTVDTNDCNHFKQYEQKNIPVVMFDRVDEQAPFTKIVIDNYRCGLLATEHLVEQGCKRIAIISGNLKRNVYAERLRGYKAALQKHKLPFSEKLVLVNDLSESDAVHAAQQILALKSRPDGLFVTNDFVAAVCMHIFKTNGLRIPEDIAIVGFNNDAISHLVNPKLSTIDYPGMDMGEIAARQLISHLKGTSDLKQTNEIIVRTALIIRDSS